MNLERQFRFALSKTLNTIAKTGVEAVRSEAQSKFTIRTNWLKSAVGPKVLPATKQDLSAAVAMRGGFLNLQEEGGIKLPSGTFIAVPARGVRRTKRDLVQKSQKPLALKNAFIATTRSGRKAIFQRVGRGRSRRVRVMYFLIPRAEIEEKPTFTSTVPRVLERDFSNTLFREFRNALATANR